MSIELMIFVGLMILGILMIIMIYNTIVSNKNAAIRAWADVVAYERQKMKILPEVEKVFGRYEKYEENVLTQITKLRETLGGLNAENVSGETLAQAEQLTRDMMAGLKITMEAYPDLKASDLAANLMREISEQQSNVTAAISIYNRNAEGFNSGIQMFPHSFVNSTFNKEVPLESFQNIEAEEGLGWKPNLN